VSSQLSRLALDAYNMLPDTCNAARSCSSRTDLGDERRASQAITASRSAGPQEPVSQGCVSGLCHRSATRRLGARFALAMGQTHRRIDPIDAVACISKCFFLRASDALDVSARRGVRVAPEASHPLLSTQTIRRPGGRAEDAIVEGTYPQNTGIPDPGTDPDAALASLTPSRPP
jgi:hypothetical protein